MLKRNNSKAFFNEKQILPPVQWEVHDHDGQPHWLGYIKGEEHYSVYLGGYMNLKTHWGDTCLSDMEGITICENHYHGRALDYGIRYVTVLVKIFPNPADPVSGEEWQLQPWPII
jgi:hypothetical protein